MTGVEGLDTIARLQSGLIARAQLRDLGWSSSGIDRAVQRGGLLRVAVGVYRVAGAPWTRLAAMHAAALLVGPAGALSGWSAAELHGFVEPRRGPVQVSIPHARRAPRVPGDLLRVRRSRHLDDGGIVEARGLPVTTAPVTLLDLAATTSVERLSEAAAAALRSGTCTVGDLERILDQRPGATGRGRLRQSIEVLGDDGSRSRSGVEVAAVRAIVDGGLPRPAVGHRVADEQGRVLAEVDLAYPELRIAIEIDGYRWHSTPAQKRADEIRQNGLVLAGWVVLRFGANDVRHRPADVVETVRAALHAARARRGTID